MIIDSLETWTDDNVNYFQVKFSIKNFDMFTILKFCNEYPEFWYDMQQKYLYYKTDDSETISDCIPKMLKATLL